MIGAKNDTIVKKMQEHRAKKLSLQPSGEEDKDKNVEDLLSVAGAGQLGRNLSASEIELQHEGGEDRRKVEITAKADPLTHRASEDEALRSQREVAQFEGGTANDSAASKRRGSAIKMESGREYRSRKSILYDDD